VTPPIARPTSPRAARRDGAIRVASIPAGHVYVRHLDDPAPRGDVRRLADIAPRDGARVPGGWWPPAMLDAEWIRANRDAFDVFHVHFGFDARTVAELGDALRALDEVGAPLVFTVHDLRNPHHRDRGPHDAQLDMLVEHAAEIVTLTPGAARAIAERWGRSATVLPHPHVVEPPLLTSPRPPRDGFVVGLHAKSLRANMDAIGVGRALRDALATLPGAELRIDVHDEVSDPNSHWYAPDAVAQLRELATVKHVRLVEHHYFSDDELWDYFLGLDVSVLPYRFGTHSGWLEACYDLGTVVVAPSCGFYAEQRPCLTYGHDEQDGLDVDSLAEAVRAAYDRRPRWRADPAARLLERRVLSAAHRDLYESVLS
jgi:glycosyltransferase involved in cell wall biosynthesis